jgi:molybdopterin/thiamine biosynthesis adenylyltransferase
MMELLLAAEDFAAIKAELTSGDTEKCAVLYASQTTRSDGTVRLLVREIEWPLNGDYTKQGVVEAELRPDFVARVTKRAKREGSVLVFVHSHPGEEAPHFSKIDSSGERQLQGFLAHRHPSLAHAAVVVSVGGARARHLGTNEEVRIVSVGNERKIVFDPSGTEDSAGKQFDRQIRAFGLAGQRALERLRIGIIGLGGTGSLVAQQLAHLGIRDFILIDPDVVELTNLNRIANANPDDIGRTKVEVAERYIHAVAKRAIVRDIKGDVIQGNVARELLNADLIFGCTDSHGSRAVIQQVSYQYFIPCIDMGVTIAVKDDGISHIYGRVQLLAPGLACLTCSNLLDANEVRQDMMTAFERRADPYIQGAHEPAPAVMSLNGTVASLAITMLLATVAGIPVAARHVLYNAMASTLRAVRAHPKADCYICSRVGSWARGDSWPLFARAN